MIVLVLITFVDLFVPMFSVLVIVRIVMSYFVRPGNRLAGGLASLTEPLIGPVRRVLPAAAGLDFAPLVTLFLLQGLQYLADGLVHP